MSCTGCSDGCDSLGVAIGPIGLTGATGATGPQGPAGNGFLFAKIVIPSAQILTGFAAPVASIAAPGAGFATEIISCVPAINTYGGAAYAVNTTIQLITDTATVAQFEDAQILLSTVARKGKMTQMATTATTDTTIIENKAVYFKVKTGNPTTGTSDLTLYVTYRTITL